MGDASTLHPRIGLFVKGRGSFSLSDSISDCLKPARPFVKSKRERDQKLVFRIQAQARAREPMRNYGHLFIQDSLPCILQIPQQTKTQTRSLIAVTPSHTPSPPSLNHKTETPPHHPPTHTHQHTRTHAPNTIFTGGKGRTWYQLAGSWGLDPLPSTMPGKGGKGTAGMQRARARALVGRCCPLAPQ